MCSDVCVVSVLQGGFTELWLCALIFQISLITDANTPAVLTELIHIEL